METEEDLGNVGKTLYFASMYNMIFYYSRNLPGGNPLYFLASSRNQSKRAPIKIRNISMSILLLTMKF